MGRHHFQQLNSLTTAEGEAGAPAISTAQLQRIVALCAAILRETAQSTDDLSERLSFLKKGIESLSSGAAWAPRIACRRNPKCHPNPLFGPPCDCRSIDPPGYDAH